jgi:hypothetical protein
MAQNAIKESITSHAPVPRLHLAGAILVAGLLTDAAFKNWMGRTQSPFRFVVIEQTLQNNSS